MSVELYIFLADARMPERAAWQQTIEQLDFPVTLYPDLSVRTHSGFLPASYGSRQSGFEFSLERAADLLADYSHLVSVVGDRDACATFRWGGDLTEMGAAVSAAAALAALSDGLYYYPDDDQLYTAEEAVAAIREDLKHVPPAA